MCFGRSIIIKNVQIIKAQRDIDELQEFEKFKNNRLMGAGLVNRS